MPYFVGIVLGILVVLFFAVARFDRDRAAYPIVLILIPSYYVLFAVLGGSTPALVIETAMMLGFTLIAVLGFARNLWWIVAAMAGHGVFDAFHNRLISNPGVPSYWPAFCGSIDVCFAACLAILLLQRRIAAAASPAGRDN